jgi:hypothetical protein
MLQLFRAVTIILTYHVCTTTAFTSPLASKKVIRAAPLSENFFLGLGEDPVENTPKELFGELSYQNFVQTYDPDGLIVKEYDILGRIRELKLLSVIADSGLLEELDERGVKVSEVERLLPKIDDINLIPLAYNNRGILRTLAPLLIEPAPVLIPLLVKALQVSATTYVAIGVSIGIVGAHEVYHNNALAGVPLISLALPIIALGSVFGRKPGMTSDATAASPITPTASAPGVRFPSFSSPALNIPAVLSAPAQQRSSPRVASVPLKLPTFPSPAAAIFPSSPKLSPSTTGKTNVRKTVRINRK